MNQVVSNLVDPTTKTLIVFQTRLREPHGVLAMDTSLT